MLLQNLTECTEFDWSFIFLQQSMLFGVNPKDADHRDLKLASDNARMMIASGLRLHKHAYS